MDHQAYQLLEREYQSTEQALRREGFATVPMEIVDEEEWIWSRVATSPDDMPDIAIWVGNWFPTEITGLFVWTGFQGPSAAIKKLSKQSLKEGFVIADSRFKHYHSIEHRLAQNGVVCERDTDRYYMGLYRFIDDRGQFSVSVSTLAQSLNEIINCSFAFEENHNGEGGSEKEALVLARRGQGRFRSAVDTIWGHRCAVSDCTVREVLRASHIKPWKQSNEREKVDGNNGILLVASLDALFDKGLISFDDDGSILIADDIDEKHRALLALNGAKLSKTPSLAQRGYLKHHRRLLE